MKLLLCVIAASLVASAGDLSGIWTGQVAAGRNGEMQDVAFKFVQNGATLTGKMYGDNESTPIVDGKIDGDQVTFAVPTELNGQQNKNVYTGTIKGDEMELTRERRPPPPAGTEARRRNGPLKVTLKRL